MAITSDNEYSVWLNKQDQPTHIAIAARAALRVFPLVAAEINASENLQQLTLLTGRAILTSAVARTWPTSDVKNAAAATTAAAKAVVTKAAEQDGEVANAKAATNAAASAANTAAFDAAAKAVAKAVATKAPVRYSAFDAAAPTFDTTYSAADAVYYSANAAAYSTTNAAYAAMKAATSDAKAANAAAANTNANAADADADAFISADDPFTIDLWHGAEMPKAIEKEWGSFQALAKDGSPWAFWREWYQSFLDGKPLDWNLQREVALIPDADWGKGPAHIAEMIEGIKARFLIDKAALSEKVDFDQETQKFYATPAPISNPRLLSTNLTLITDALDEAMRGNGLRPGCWEDRTLRKTVERFTDDPERIEMDCMRVHRRLTAKLGNELPESDELVDLSTTLLDVALDIRANHPDIAENRAKRGAQAVREASADEKALLKEAIPHIRAITDENLGQQIEDDIGEILEGEVLTTPEDLALAVDPIARTGSRLAKISLTLVKRGVIAAGGIVAVAGGIVAIDAAIPILKTAWAILLKLLGF